MARGYITKQDLLEALEGCSDDATLYFKDDEGKSHLITRVRVMTDHFRNGDTLDNRPEIVLL